MILLLQGETEIPHEISLKFDILVTYMHTVVGRARELLWGFADNCGDLLKKKLELRELTLVNSIPNKRIKASQPIENGLPL